MGARRDAGLAAIVLLATCVGIVVSAAALSISWLLLGGVATLVFEFVASRRPATIRRYWERPAIRVASLALAGVFVLVAARLASSSALSALAGALVAYLGLLGALEVFRLVWTGT